MRSDILLRIFFLLLQCSLGKCLHYYLRSGETKCFYENLDKGELLAATFLGQVEQEDGTYDEDEALTFHITIFETFDNNHCILDQKSVPPGPFAFSGIDKGEHKICLQPHHIDSSKRVKITHDVNFGNAVSIQSKRNSAMLSLKERIRQLNERLLTIKNEQEEIKLKEPKFRSTTEETNQKVMYLSIVVSVVLVFTCKFQLRYLKTLLVKKKQK